MTSKAYLQPSSKLCNPPVKPKPKVPHSPMETLPESQRPKGKQPSLEEPSCSQTHKINRRSPDAHRHSSHCGSSMLRCFVWSLGRKELGGAAPCGVDTTSETLSARQAEQTQSSPFTIFFLVKAQILVEFLLVTENRCRSGSCLSGGRPVFNCPHFTDR